MYGRRCISILPKVPLQEIERLLRSKAVVARSISSSPTGKMLSKSWSYPEGLAGYLREQAGDYEAVAPDFAGEKHAAADDDTFANGEGASWAYGWFLDAVPSESYVNLIPTVNGGTHESGLRAGVFEAVKSFVEHHALPPRGVKLQQEDVCGRMAFVLRWH